MLTELARYGESSSIRDLWHIAKMTCNQRKVVAAKPPPATHHLDMYASNTQQEITRPSSPCCWCGSPSHLEEHCYSKDTTNIQHHPSHTGKVLFLPTFWPSTAGTALARKHTTV